MLHEKFYKFGVFQQPSNGIYIGWVAHENSAYNKMPIKKETGNVTLFLTGECYIDKNIIRELEKKGYKAEDSESDWILHDYEEKGISFLNDLNGLFSGVLVDNRKNELYVFTDIYGMERIYYYSTKEAFYFSSEAKAILKTNSALRAFDKDGLIEYLALGCCLNWKSIFRYLKIIPGGSYLKINYNTDNLVPREYSYFSIKEWKIKNLQIEKNRKIIFLSAFPNIVQNYTKGPNRIGFSLTGGHDSRMIAACIKNLDISPVAYTFSGNESLTRDVIIAKAVANAMGMEHHAIKLEQDFFSEFDQYSDKTVYVSDGMLGICGAHELYLNAKAKELSPVRLTGNFGGEILRSVTTFKTKKIAHEVFSYDFRVLIRNFEKTFYNSYSNAVEYAAFKEVPWNLFGTYSAAKSQIIFRTPYLDKEIVKMAYNAHDKIELHDIQKDIVRNNLPILSFIPTDREDHYTDFRIVDLLKKAYYEGAFRIGYYLNEGMPDYLGIFNFLIDKLDTKNRIVGLHRYLYYRKWFKNELFEFLQNRMPNIYKNSNGIWNKKYLDSLINCNRIKKRDFLNEINMIITLDSIERQFINL